MPFTSLGRLPRLLIGAALVILLGAILLPLVIRASYPFLFGPVNVFTITLPQSAELPNDHGRTNILLLGVGGKKHDGPNLTDTIMVVSIKSRFAPGELASKHPIVLVSIPRDLYLNSIPGKINSAYAFGLEKGGVQQGFEAAKGVVTEVTNLPIHYTIKVDFSAFEKIVDLLGGIDVSVEHAFDDPLYPISGKENDTCGFSPDEITTKLLAVKPEEEFPCRFEKLHFAAGETHMNGETALKFVRSRHASGNEGSDLARAKRQQLVLSALKAKFFTSTTLLDLNKIESVYEIVKDNVATDITPNVYHPLFSLLLRYRSAQLESLVIGFDQLWLPPMDYRGSILVPKTGNFEEIQSLIEKKLQSVSEASSSAKSR